MNVSLFVLVLISTLILETTASPHPAAATGGVNACFFGSWARYRPGHGAVGAEDLDPTGCTHLIYTFAGLDPKTNEIISLDPWNDLPTGGGYGSYEIATGLKEDFPDLKVTLSVGGATQGSNNYASMAHDPDSRATFVSSVVKFLKPDGYSCVGSNGHANLENYNHGSTKDNSIFSTIP